MAKKSTIRINSLKDHYNNTVLPILLAKGQYENIHSIPKIEKIVINLSTKRAVIDSKNILPARVAMEIVTGRRAKTTKARKSIANFKLREKMVLGCKVTLRGNEMYTFLTKLVNIVLPRVYDFEGLSNKSFDGRGNFTLGIPNLFAFPELEEFYDSFNDKNYGCDITITTSAKTNDEARVLLTALQLPILDTQ